MGTARSGTTILEILLGNAPSVANAGELTHAFRDGFADPVVCSCGEPASRCEIWGHVRELCFRDVPTARKHDRLVRSVDWHDAFPRVAAGLTRGRRFARYQTLQGRLLRALGDVSGAEVLVDGSIYPGRALALSRAFPDRVSVICLTRSPVGLISAFRTPREDEQPSKSLLATLLYYGYVLLCLQVALWRLPEEVLRLRFEELRERPAETLDRLEEWSGRDLTAVRRKLEADELFDVGHILTGNRIRRRGRVKFRRGRESEPVTGFGERLAAVVMDLYRRLLGF